MIKHSMWRYYLIPIGVHWIFLPFLYFEQLQTKVSLIEMAVGTIVIPIYLIIISYKFIDKISIGNFAITLLLMIGITIIGILISYFNWGILTGKLLKPDSGTIHIINFQMIIASIIVITGWIVACIIKYRM